MKKLFLRNFSSQNRRLILFLLLILLLGIGLWLVPLNGKILIVPDSSQNYTGAWPRIVVEPLAAKPGQLVTVSLSDVTAWQQVKLLVANQEATLVNAASPNSTDGLHTWKWTFKTPVQLGYTAVFYRDCQIGCIEQARFQLGTASASDSSAPLIPTKLGVVFADPQRNWHNRAGWDVELTYSQLPKDLDFSFDAVAEKVLANAQRGLRVLVRVDYDKNQSLPPAGDEAALKNYLNFCARLARDARFKDVYGYIIGSSFNRVSSNSLVSDKLVTPEWYARIFNGYGLDSNRLDNVIQTFHSLNTHAQILVGPVTPWVTDQTGPITNTPDAPWLNYMNSLVDYLDVSSTAKATAGFPEATPDGFAVQAPGRPEAVANPAQEPLIDIYDPEWSGTEYGFRVYQDWLNIINKYRTTRGLPVYITSTNTYTPDLQIEPAQNYPAGWLTNALEQVDSEPQIKALCWYTDLPYDKWANYSLQAQLLRVKSAALEFEELLKQN